MKNSNFKGMRSERGIKKNKMTGKLPLETHARAWVKSITWRILGAIVLGLITWFTTHNWIETTIITLIFHVIQLVLYYFHERIWERINWGRIKHPLGGLNLNKELTNKDKKIIEKVLSSLGYID